MLGLFGTLNLGTRSLQAQQTAVEVAGQNLANVNNPAYARQRVQIQTSVTLNTPIGPQGTGAEAIAIQQIRDALLDNQVQGELSVGGYWNSNQAALQYAQAGLGEFIDSTSGTATSADGNGRGLAYDLSSLFSAFQSVATSPESLTDRQMLLNNAQMLATRLNQTSTRLDEVQSALDTTLNGNVTDANQLLADIAKLNDKISSAEVSNGTANDLRDLRQQKLESLSKLANITTSAGSNGAVNISIDGNQLVSDQTVVDTLQTYDAGGGQMLVRTVTGATPLNLTGGQMKGTIDACDGALATVRNGLDTLAAQLIARVNTIHSTGFGLTTNTVADANFFTGTDASDIAVNTTLIGDPALIRLSGVSGAAGDNTVALQLAQLANTPQAALGNLTFNAAYNTTVAGLGYALNNANTQIADSDKVQAMLSQRRDSVSGVSIDEEMTDLIRFQKAYAASAKLVSTVDEMLDTILNMKR